MEFNQLEGYYSCLPIITCIFAGLMIDHWGIGRSIVLFSIVSIIGLCVYEYSAVTENFTMAFIGRSIFGMGSEAQSIYIATAINIWFRFDGLRRATAIVALSGSLGSVLSNYLSITLYENYKNPLVTLPPALFINCLAMFAVIWVNVI
jgi:MFS family permease